MKIADIHSACLKGLSDFAESVGFTQVVIGLSGGLDSSVVACLCAEAFGAENVHGVLLPGPYSSEHSVEDAQVLADNLDIETRMISIVEPFEAFERVMASSMKDGLSGLAAENTQARCRMVCLMALSNAQGWMLVNTGNKSEAMMGYSTLYGDTAGAFAPLGGIYKTEVFALAHHLNDEAEAKGGVAPIPHHVLIKPPSAELSPDQSDEVGMGIDYTSLDRILSAHFEHDRSADSLVAEGFDAATVERVIATAEGYAFKRAMEPPYPSQNFYA